MLLAILLAVCVTVKAASVAELKAVWHHAWHFDSLIGITIERIQHTLIYGHPRRQIHGSNSHPKSPTFITLEDRFNCVPTLLQATLGSVKMEVFASASCPCPSLDEW